MFLENWGSRILCERTMDAGRGSYDDAGRKAGWGNQHVRFDERGRETERALQSTATAPVLDFLPNLGALGQLPNGR